MNGLLHDFRYALRQLRRSPGFTAVAVITLGLGIGANTAVFSVVEGVVLAPLDYFQADRLVMVWENNPRFPRVWNSHPNFQDWQRTARSFEPMAAFREQAVDLTSPGTPSHRNSKQISPGFFSPLGVGLALGREFTSQESQRGGPPVAVISNRVWKERFARSAEVLAKTVIVSGVNYSIVGVAPQRFRIEDDADIYTPLGQLDPLVLTNRASHDGLFTIARLKSGVEISQSQSEISTIQSGLDHLYPDDNRDLGIYVESLKQAIVGDAGQVPALLLGAVGLLLLIARANIANLLLARSAARNREFAIRAALGANRARVARQLLSESAVLSASGACVGLLIAWSETKFVLSALPNGLPRIGEISVDVPVLVYTLVVPVVVGILFGLAPAVKTWSSAPETSLKQGGRGSMVPARRAQSSFAIVQLALTLVLLVGAGLLFRTILRLSSVNPGFQIQNIATFKVGISQSLAKTPASTRIPYQQLIERIRRIPGVRAADFTTAVPLTGEGGYLPFWLDSNKPESLQGVPRLQSFLTGTDYLRVLEIPLLQGRFLNENDTTNSPCVAVINSNFANKFFPHGKAIGHTITAGFAAFGPCAIIGVVNHVKDAGLNDASAVNQYQTYYSLYQVPDQWVPLNYPDARVIVRTPLDLAALIPAVKATIYQAASDQPIYDVQSMRQIVTDSMSRKPSLLLGDEPTDNLHSSQAKEIMEMFRELNQQGTTIVQVTHAGANAAYGSRTIQLRDGWMVSDTANPELQPHEAVNQ